LLNHSSYTQAQADCAAVSFELFYARELHDRSTDVFKTLLCEVGAGDVLDVRAQVDSRVLLRVSVGGCVQISTCANPVSGVPLTKRVVDTGAVVTNGLWCPVADEYAASVLDQIYNLLCVVDLKD
jgi:hypothetical protein